MTDPATDAALVSAHLAGDRGALATMYDRFADRLYDTAAAMLGDRHEAADVVQDVFVVAAERLDQLRDPTRLRPWLFAILRNEVYRRTDRRRRAVPTDFTEPGRDMTAPPDDGADGEAVELEELAVLVRGAARGLDARDQLVLELSVRQGLEGAELAAALGVTAQQSYGLVHRMRERTGRSLGAFCVARAGRRDCAELASILAGWDGAFSVLWRKRVARHVDDCEICERTRRKFAPLTLLGSAPALAAPPELRDRVLAAAPAPPAYGFGAEGGFPRLVRSSSRLLAACAVAVVAVLLIGGTTYVVAGRSGSTAAPVTTDDAPLTTPTANDVPVSTVDSTDSTDTAPASDTTIGSTSTSTTSSTSTPTTTTSTTAPTSTTPTPSPTPAPGAVDPPPAPTSPPAAPDPTTGPTTTTAAPPAGPGRLELGTTSIDLGPDSSNASVTVANAGGSPIGVSVVGGEPFGVSLGAATLQPGQRTEISITFARSGAAEGDVQSGARVIPDTGGETLLSITASVEHPPAIQLVGQPAPTYEDCATGSGFTPRVVAGVADESAIGEVRLDWTRPDGSRGSRPAALRDGQYHAPFLDQPIDGTWNWSLHATDGRGNAASVSGSFEVACRSR